MAADKQLPVAGWYPDPDQPHTQRYWDGTRWTDQRAPLTPESRGRGAGVLLIASYFAALLIPIVGLILGIVLLTRRETGHGIAVVLISLAVGVAGYFLVLDETENGRRDSADRNERQIEDSRGFRALVACLKENGLDLGCPHSRLASSVWTAVGELDLGSRRVALDLSPGDESLERKTAERLSVRSV